MKFETLKSSKVHVCHFLFVTKRKRYTTVRRRVGLKCDSGQMLAVWSSKCQIYIPVEIPQKRH